MGQLAGSDTCLVSAWRQRIRNDALSNHAVSMAVAIFHREGPQAALPWLERALGDYRYEGARIVLLSIILRHLNRVEEAERLETTSRASNPGFELAGIAVVLDIFHKMEAINSAFSSSLADRAVEISAQSGDVTAHLAMRARRARHLLRTGQLESASSDIRKICDTDAPVVPGYSDLPDILSTLSKLLAQNHQLEQVLAVDGWFVDLLYQMEKDAINYSITSHKSKIMSIVGYAFRNADAKTLSRIVPRIIDLVDWKDENSRDHLLKHAVLMLHRDMDDAVVTVYRFLQGLQNDGVGRAWLLAEIVAASDNPARYHDQIDQAIQTAPSHPPLLLAIARALLCLGRPADVLAVTDHLPLDKRPPLMFVLRTLARLAVEDHAGAAVELDFLEHTGPLEERTLATKAMCLLATGRAGDAHALLERQEKERGATQGLLFGLTSHAMGQTDMSRVAVRKVIDSCSCSLLRNLVNTYLPFRDDLRNLLIEAGGEKVFSSHVVQVD